MFIEEINVIAMGYSTGHFQLWDCKIKRIMYVFYKHSVFFYLNISNMI